MAFFWGDPDKDCFAMNESLLERSKPIFDTLRNTVQEHGLNESTLRNRIMAIQRDVRFRQDLDIMEAKRSVSALERDLELRVYLIPSRWEDVLIIHYLYLNGLLHRSPGGASESVAPSTRDSHIRLLQWGALPLYPGIVNPVGLEGFHYRSAVCFTIDGASFDVEKFVHMVRKHYQGRLFFSIKDAFNKETVVLPFESQRTLSIEPMNQFGMVSEIPGDGDAFVDPTTEDLMVPISCIARRSKPTRWNISQAVQKEEPLSTIMQRTSNNLKLLSLLTRPVSMLMYSLRFNDFRRDELLYAAEDLLTATRRKQGAPLLFYRVSVDGDAPIVGQEDPQERTTTTRRDTHRLATVEKSKPNPIDHMDTKDRQDTMTSLPPRSLHMVPATGQKFARVQSASKLKNKAAASPMVRREDDAKTLPPADSQSDSFENMSLEDAKRLGPLPNEIGSIGDLATAIEGRKTSMDDLTADFGKMQLESDNHNPLPIGYGGPPPSPAPPIGYGGPPPPPPTPPSAPPIGYGGPPPPPPPPPAPPIGYGGPPPPPPPPPIGYGGPPPPPPPAPPIGYGPISTVGTPVALDAQAAMFAELARKAEERALRRMTTPQKKISFYYPYVDRECHEFKGYKTANQQKPEEASELFDTIEDCEKARKPRLRYKAALDALQGPLTVVREQLDLSAADVESAKTELAKAQNSLDTFVASKEAIVKKLTEQAAQLAVNKARYEEENAREAARKKAFGLKTAAKEPESEPEKDPETQFAEDVARRAKAVASRERKLHSELPKLEKLTKTLALIEAYMNKYIFTPLAESVDRLEDTIDFHSYLKSKRGKETGPYQIHFVAQGFANFFDIGIPADYGQPAVNPGDISLTSSLAKQVIEDSDVLRPCLTPAVLNALIESMKSKADPDYGKDTRRRTLAQPSNTEVVSPKDVARALDHTLETLQSANIIPSAKITALTKIAEIKEIDDNRAQTDALRKVVHDVTVEATKLEETSTIPLSDTDRFAVGSLGMIPSASPMQAARESVPRSATRSEMKKKKSSSVGKVRAVTQIHRLREANKILKQQLERRDGTSIDPVVLEAAEQVADEIQKMEESIEQRKPQPPDKAKTVWGRAIDALQAGNRKVALSAKGLVGAVTSYGMYSLASGMIPTNITDAALEVAAGATSVLTDPTMIPVQLIPVDTGLTAVTAMTSSIMTSMTSNAVLELGSAAAPLVSATMTQAALPILATIVAAGGAVFALNKIANKYLVAAPNSKGEMTTTVLTVQPGTDNLTIEDAKAFPEEAKKVQTLLDKPTLRTYAEVVGVKSAEPVVSTPITNQEEEKPVFIPLPPPSRKELKSVARREGNSNFDKAHKVEKEGKKEKEKPPSPVLTDRIMRVYDMLRNAPPVKDQSRRIVVIRGEAREPKIEFVR